MTMEHEHSSKYDTAAKGSTSLSKRTGSTKGRYLQEKPGRYLKDQPASPRRRRRRRRKLNPRFVILVAVLLTILIGIAVGISSCRKPSILGRWDLDGTTVYEFNKGGKGKLILFTAEYDFNYEIDDGVLSIDFIDEYALDSRYRYEVKGRMLLMTGGPGDAQTDYVLFKDG